jgi:hypothetical protein
MRAEMIFAMTLEPRRKARHRAMKASPLLALALSACGGGIVPPRPASLPPAQPSPAMAQSAARFAGLIGADARALIRLFGEPRLDIRDPAARKLQFSDGLCVLDAYLYPPRAKREPLVTFAEARTSDGGAMDWADCAIQLRKR